jgi:hypothetical protein
MSQREFPRALEDWIVGESLVRSAVRFGSTANRAQPPFRNNSKSDIDLHIVSPNALKLENVNWSSAMPGQGYYFRAVRPATGGVRKMTVLFSSGQIDLVIVPELHIRAARFAFKLGLHRRFQFLGAALNEMATCLANGYSFLKGESVWGRFYAQISKMPGVRLSNQQLIEAAEVFICDLLWIIQKISDGELAAAQHLIHRSLSETNFRLIRELRLRSGLVLPSFGLGRRVEFILNKQELVLVQIDARLEATSLRQAAWKAFDGFHTMMNTLVPEWQIPQRTAGVLGSIRSAS